MRILLITQWFDPEPTFKGLLFARELVRRGHSVTVLTGFPNYPGGKIYPGYKIRPWKREVIDGVDVLRVALFPSHSRSGIARAANYLSFAVTATIGALLLRRPDVAYLYHPPGTVGLAALALKILKRVPFIIDIQDMWPDTLGATGMLSNRRILSAIGALMSTIYRAAAHIVVLSPGFGRLLAERGVSTAKVTVIPNWTYDVPVPRDADGQMQPILADGFNILFAGTMGYAQALDVVLEAAALLREQAPDVRFVFVGSGIDKERLQTQAAKLGLDRVVFLPRRAPSEMPQVFNEADALLVHLRRDPLFEITIPSKTQAYLQAGRPILMGVDGDAKDIVTAAHAGIPFSPEDPQALADAVLSLRALPADVRGEMGRSGRRYYDEQLSIATGVDRFASLFEQVLARSRRTARRS